MLVFLDNLVGLDILAFLDNLAFKARLSACYHLPALSFLIVSISLFKLST